jgi:hypothetical protein
MFHETIETTDRIQVFQPVNANRDLYLPLIIDGKKFVLPMQEADPCLDSKQKELFWILLTECAKSRPISRAIVWFAFAVALTLSSLSVINNVLRATVGKSFYQILESISWSTLFGICT